MGPGVKKFSGRVWDWDLKFFFQFTQDRDQKRLENLKFLKIGIGTWSQKIFWSRLGLGFEIFFPIHSRLGSIETRKFWSTQGCINRGWIKNQSTQGWDQERSNDTNLVETWIQARPQFSPRDPCSHGSQPVSCTCLVSCSYLVSCSFMKFHLVSCSFMKFYVMSCSFCNFLVL